MQSFHRVHTAQRPCVAVSCVGAKTWTAVPAAAAAAAAACAAAAAAASSRAFDFLLLSRGCNGAADCTKATLCGE